MDNYVPKHIYPEMKDFDVPKDVSEVIHVEKYNVLVDGDSLDDKVYLNMGYDNKTEYDSSFFLTADDAYKLGEMLIKKSSAVLNASIVKARSEIFMYEFKKRLLLNEVVDVAITFLNPYTLNPEDTNFGKFIVRVEYSTESDEDMIGCELVSDDMMDTDTSDRAVLERFIYDKLKLYNVKNACVYDIENLLKNIDMLRKKRSSYIRKDQEVNEMLPREATDGLLDAANKFLKSQEKKD